MRRDDWQWVVEPNAGKHTERICVIRGVAFESTTPGLFKDETDESHEELEEADRGRALTLNISSGGMLLLMDREPYVSQVFKVQVPTTLALTTVGTLAEVAWVRRVPMGSDLRFVGLRFLL